MYALPPSPPIHWQMTGDIRVIAWTTPANALRTARFLEASTYRATTRYIDPAWGPEVKAQFPRLQLVKMLKRTAKKAKRAGAKVAFITESGGYPWRGTPQVWHSG